MKIRSFNTETGVYEFELEQLETDWHAHPAMEVIIASDTSIHLETDNGLYQDVSFALIDANVRHKVYSDQPVQLYMIEGSVLSLKGFYQSQKFELEQGVLVQELLEDGRNTLTRLIKALQGQQLLHTMDARVQGCVEYFKKKEIQYPEMMQSLQAQTHLSDSRLSHLFKQEMGVSLKKYLLWSRLRDTIGYVISDQLSLYEAGLRSGFYDQAHLSKAFKQMLGLSPSTVFNSRMIQE